MVIAMDLPPAWYDAIAMRSSVRRYLPMPVPGETVERLRVVSDDLRRAVGAGLQEAPRKGVQPAAGEGSQPAEVEGSQPAESEGVQPSPAARIVLIEHDAGSLFTGVLGKFLGSYGRVEGATLAAAFIGRAGHEGEVGYVGEAFILEATSLGLSTCWIAGTFDKERAAGVAELAEGERVVALTPLGFAGERPRGERFLRRALKAWDRLPIEKIAPGIDGGAAGGDDPTAREAAGAEPWPAWARSAVEAARRAPSGANRQPCRFRLDGDGLVLSRASKIYWTAPIDFGIARLHVELGAAHEGVRGTWETLADPDVARFVPEDG